MNRTLAAVIKNKKKKNEEENEEELEDYYSHGFIYMFDMSQIETLHTVSEKGEPSTRVAQRVRGGGQEHRNVAAQGRTRASVHSLEDRGWEQVRPEDHLGVDYQKHCREDGHPALL